MAAIYTTRDGDVLDAICAGHYGVGHEATLLTVVLEANRGLADKGDVYPAGMTILLPDWSPPPGESEFRLWD